MPQRHIIVQNTLQINLTNGLQEPPEQFEANSGARYTVPDLLVASLHVNYVINQVISNRKSAVSSRVLYRR